MPGNRDPAPEDRHFAHYIEQHASNSVDEAVARAERWARALLRRHPVPPIYPESAWFAEQIVEELHAVRYYLGQSQGEARKAVWYALRLGEMVAEARLRNLMHGPRAGGATLPIPPGPDAPDPAAPADAP
jgi:hypothetical protein